MGWQTLRWCPHHDKAMRDILSQATSQLHFRIVVSMERVSGWAAPAIPNSWHLFATEPSWWPGVHGRYEGNYRMQSASSDGLSFDRMGRLVCVFERVRCRPNKAQAKHYQPSIKKWWSALQECPS